MKTGTSSSSERWCVAWQGPPDVHAGSQHRVFPTEAEARAFVEHLRFGARTARTTLVVEPAAARCGS